MKQTILFLVLVAGLTLYSQAQSFTPEVIASAGDHFTGKSGSISSSLFILRVINLKSHPTESFKIHKVNF